MYGVESCYQMVLAGLVGWYIGQFLSLVQLTLKSYALMTSVQLKSNAHLLKYDTVHGILPANVAVHGDTMDAGQGPVRVTAERNPAKLPWKELDIDVALECTGFFANLKKRRRHT